MKRRTLSDWRVLQRIHTKSFDVTPVSAEDAVIFKQFSSGVTPSLPLVPMDRRVRLRFSTLALSEQREIRAAYLAGEDRVKKSSPRIRKLVVHARHKRTRRGDLPKTSVR